MGAQRIEAADDWDPYTEQILVRTRQPNGMTSDVAHLAVDDHVIACRAIKTETQLITAGPDAVLTCTGCNRKLGFELSRREKAAEEAAGAPAPDPAPEAPKDPEKPASRRYEERTSGGRAQNTQYGSRTRDKSVIKNRHADRTDLGLAFDSALERVRSGREEASIPDELRAGPMTLLELLGTIWCWRDEIDWAAKVRVVDHLAPGSSLGFTISEDGSVVASSID